MNREGFCRYHSPACQSGCKKVICKAFFPTRKPIIMESQLTQCESLDHVNCEQFKAGNAYREEKQLSHVGCTFLRDKICGKPGIIYCTGNVPPFPIEPDNHPESCYGSDFKDCPYYKIGVAFAEEARRKKDKKGIKV